MDTQLTTEDRITTIEAAQMLGVSRMTIHRWLEAEKLPYAVIGGRRVLFRSLIEEWAESHNMKRFEKEV
jgi:excisionase family DNA binding protein